MRRSLSPILVIVLAASFGCAPSIVSDTFPGSGGGGSSSSSKSTSTVISTGTVSVGHGGSSSTTMTTMSGVSEGSWTTGTTPSGSGGWSMTSGTSADGGWSSGSTVPPGTGGWSTGDVSDGGWGSSSTTWDGSGGFSNTGGGFPGTGGFGVSTAASGGEGGSSPFCGGIPGILCSFDRFCNYPTGSCGSADQTGTCDPKPTSCPGPTTGSVCGCDGNTYPSACYAHMAGTDVATNPGTCQPSGTSFACGPILCITGQVCRETEGMSNGTTYNCEPLPPGCTSCACVPDDSACFGCGEDSNGGIYEQCSNGL